MTALLTLERGEARATRSRPSDYRARAGRVEDRPAAGRADDASRDLLRGLLLESGNDAAVTLAEGVAGSRSAFVRR